MKVNPYLPAPVNASRKPRDEVAPIQPLAPTPDPASHQRRASAQLVASRQDRELAASILSKDAETAMRDAREPKARKALEAYASVANTQEREYVSRVLGFSEFA